MNTLKSTIVTALVAVLFGVAAFAAYRLCMPAFVVMTAAFAAFGFLCAASLFCGWLEQESAREEEAVEPIKLNSEPDLGPEFTATYDEIKRELEARP